MHMAYSDIYMDKVPTQTELHYSNANQVSMEE